MQSLPFPGDVVWIRQQRWRVRRALRDGNVVRLDVTSRARALTFLAPFDRVVVDRAVVRPRRVRRQEARARLANLVARAPDPRLPLTVLDAKLDVLPHQLEPALAMMAGHTRVLIADEVGLGKTIQAGIVIAEVLRRDVAPRVLVLAPAALCAQWVDELGTRFHLKAERADRDGLQALSRVIPHGENPWRRARLWIGSPDYMKQAHVRASLPVDPWDLVVIDEAHAVAGDSERHEACAAIARHARRVLLLTATPHTGDEPRFQRLLALGALPGSPAPVVFRRTRSSLGVTGTRVVRWHRVTPHSTEDAALECLRSYERAVLATVGGDETGALLLLSVLRKRALSTFAALGATISRRLAWIDRDSPSAGEYTPFLPWDVDEDPADVDEREAVTARLALDPRREALWLQRLKRLVYAAARVETKAVRLARLIERTTEPVVVFTEFRDSLDVALRHLRLNRSVAWIHGGQDGAEQRGQLRRFQTRSASILLATDVAGQGLNLQDSARWVISLEVPWNPARLEQRIGRVDRIGQQRRTHLTVLVSRHEAESGLLLHLTRRVLRARAALGDRVLIDVPTEEARIAVRLLKNRGDGTEAMPPATTTVPSSRRWRRAGTVAAQAVQQRRQLAHYWRPPATPSELPHIVSRDASRNDPADRLVVTATPILNGLDELVAIVLTPCRVAAWIARGGIARCVTAIQRMAAGTIARRLRRLAHREATSACRLNARDRLISDAGRSSPHLFELQPGLFDQRDVATHDAARLDIATLESAQHERIERRTASRALRTGDPGVIVTLHRADRGRHAD